MEEPRGQMELIGSIDGPTAAGLLAGAGIVLLEELERPSSDINSDDLRSLSLMNNGNGSANNRDNNGVLINKEEDEEEDVDAFHFFGKKNKAKKRDDGDNSEEQNKMKKFFMPSGSRDDGDSKGFWGASSSNKATMPVHMDSEVYNMSHPKRGKAIIFNHEEFHPQLDLGRRHGTEKDKLNLTESLGKLGFDVTAYDDLTYHQIVEKVDKMTKVDHAKHDCVLIAVLSHGDHQLLYAKDYSYKPDFLWQAFTADRCPTLAGKPKIFLIQACQGSQLDEGTKLVRVSNNRTETDSNPQSYRIPNHADFLIAFSTVPGYYSWRNTTNGSWFMQAMAEVLTKYSSKKDLLSMMTIVSRKVALNFESNTPSQPHMHQKKQMPFITSTLIRDVYLTPK